jgi:hypothetical protein
VRRCNGMGPWLVDIESFEQVSQDAPSRRLVLRMAQLSREGRLAPFVTELAADPEFDEDTRAVITELACDEAFLLAVEDYLGRMSVVH